MGKSNTGQAFWISIGNLLALLCTIGATMVMSRLYSRVDYGTYKQIFWIYSSLSIVFTLGLPKAFGYFLARIPIEEGNSLTTKITNLFFILGGIISVIFFVLSKPISIALNNPDLAFGLKVFSPVPFFLIPTMGIDAIYATYRRTEVSALYLIASKGFLALCLISSAIIYSKSYIYAIIAFDIASFGSFLLALFLKKKPFKRITHIKTAITYKEIFLFSLPLMGANIINIIINSTDQFFISRFWGVTDFALFSNGAMELPFIGMIVGATSVVLLPVYSKIKSNHSIIECKVEIINLWNSVYIKCIKLIYPLVVFCMVFAYEIMVILYGENYYQSGSFFRIMLVNNFFAIISTYPLILALNKVNQYMMVYAFDAILLISLELLCVYFFKNIYIVCVISVFCLALRNILFIYIIARTLKEKLFKLIPFKLVIHIFILSLISCFTIQYICSVFNFPLVLHVALAFILTSILYLILSHFTKLDYISIFLPLIPTKLRKKITC